MRGREARQHEAVASAAHKHARAYNIAPGPRRGGPHAPQKQNQQPPPPSPRDSLLKPWTRTLDGAARRVELSVLLGARQQLRRVAPPFSVYRGRGALGRRRRVGAPFRQLADRHDDARVGAGAEDDADLGRLVLVARRREDADAVVDDRGDAARRAGARERVCAFAFALFRRAGVVGGERRAQVRGFEAGEQQRLTG